MRDFANRNLRVLHDAVVEGTDDLLDAAEGAEQLTPGGEDFVRKHILLAVDPQVGEAFLGRIENFCQVAQ